MESIQRYFDPQGTGDEYGIVEYLWQNFGVCVFIRSQDPILPMTHKGRVGGVAQGDIAMTGLGGQMDDFDVPL